MAKRITSSKRTGAKAGSGARNRRVGRSRKAGGNGAAATPAAAAATRGVPKVRVRMFRQGLGDCFLLTFDLGGNERHMLIDCGTLGSTTTGVTIKQVVQNIHDTTGGHLHLVVATHEHKDHISGFGSERDAFVAMHPDHVWMAWTENPADEVAQQIAKYKNDLGASLAAAAGAALAGGTDPQVGRTVHDLLGFAGDPDAAMAGAAGLAEGLNEIMNFVRRGLGPEATYLKPGGPAIEPEWLPGFRFYVLGPPRSKAKLSDMGDDQSDDLYHLSAGGRSGGLRAAAAAHRAKNGGKKLTAEEAAEVERQAPFDKRFRHEIAAGRRCYPHYFKGEAWRRIDLDWLQATPELALQLDSLTNNTSLAFAIERVADKKVLLFPADAQQGHWLSWHDEAMTWTVKDPGGGGATRTVTAKDLLARTVFYKVGHHCSHNATASRKGLELMEAEKELTAFIPVDRKVALGKSPPGSWRMPARALYRRLLTKCQGRLARADLGWVDDAARAKDKKTESELADVGTAAEWKAWREGQTKGAGKRVTVSDVFIDFLLD